MKIRKHILISNLICYLALCFLEVNAAVPTAEGLFRNANNAAATGNKITIKIVVKKDDVKGALEDSELQKEISDNPLYIKIVSLKYRDSRKFMQLNYSKKSMSDDSLIDVFYYPDFENFLLTDSKVGRSFFYSAISMLGHNDSGPIGALLKRYGQPYRTNKELMDQDKIELYKNYKKYLQKSRAKRKTIRSPLRPRQKEQRLIVKELVKRPMYEDTGHVKLVRKNHKFFWHVDYEILDLFFTNDKHRLSLMKLSLPTSHLQVNYGNYILLDGTHEIPTVFVVQNDKKEVFRIQVLELRHGKDKMSSLEGYYRNYQNILEGKTVVGDGLTVKPDFLF